MPHEIIAGLIYFLCGFTDGRRPPTKEEMELTTREQYRTAQDRAVYHLDDPEEV